MTDMPERIWIWEHDEDCSRTYSVPGEPYPTGSPEYRRADAPPNVDEAMRCPEVAAAYLALQSAQESIATFIGVHGYPKDSGAGLVLDEVSAALAPFAEGPGISPRNGPKPGY